LGTIDFLEHFQVDFSSGQLRILLVKPAANQANKQLARIKHRLQTLAGRELTPDMQ
jgi:hypothetical protein